MASIIAEMNEVKRVTDKLPYDCLVTTIVLTNQYKLRWEIQNCSETGGTINTPGFAFVPGHPKNWSVSFGQGKDEFFYVKLNRLEDDGQSTYVRYKGQAFDINGEWRGDFNGCNTIRGKGSIILRRFNFFNLADDKVILKIYFTVYGDDIETCSSSYVKSQDVDLMNLRREYLMKVSRDQYADLTIHVGTNKYRAHKSILCFRAPEFAKKYLDGSGENTITISNIHPKEFGHVLAYIYAGGISTDALRSNAAETYKAAYDCRIRGLQRKCGEYLVENLSRETVCEVFGIAEQCKDDELKKAACTFMIANINVLNNISEFQNLRSARPDFISELKMLAIKP